jgi:hypothetical protein
MAEALPVLNLRNETSSLIVDLIPMDRRRPTPPSVVDKSVAPDAETHHRGRVAAAVDARSRETRFKRTRRVTRIADWVNYRPLHRFKGFLGLAFLSASIQPSAPSYHSLLHSKGLSNLRFASYTPKKGVSAGLRLTRTEGTVYNLRLVPGRLLEAWSVHFGNPTPNSVRGRQIATPNRHDYDLFPISTHHRN